MAIKTSDLHKAIMQRDQCTEEEAHQLVKGMAEAVLFYNEDPEEVLHNEGFEPDYVFDLLYHSI